MKKFQVSYTMVVTGFIEVEAEDEDCAEEALYERSYEYLCENAQKVEIETEDILEIGEGKENGDRDS